MTTKTVPLSPTQRLTQWFYMRRIKSNKRSIAIDRLEWQTQLKVAQAVFGMVITGFSIMVAWLMITGPEQIAGWIARFLADVNQSAGGTVSFDVLLKSFGVALIVLINMTITVFVVAVDEPELFDVLQTIAESDDRTMNRLAEFEHQVTEQLDRIERNDMAPAGTAEVSDDAGN